MLFRSCTPAPPLSNFVENLWFYSGFESPRLKERILPTGTFEFVFNLRDDELRIYEETASHEFQRYSGAIVSGPYIRSFVTDTALEASVMGIHFKPGGAFPFLGPSAEELRNCHIGLEAIWGRAATELRNRLCETKSIRHRFRLLERCLISHLFRPLQHHRAVAMALATLDRAAVQMTRELAREARLSEKRFIDVFRAEIGLNPRVFNRICRFQRVLALTHRAAVPDWAQLAVDHGYFDQSHLIRDFTTFAGFSPADYTRRLCDLRKRGLQAKFNHLPVA